MFPKSLLIFFTAMMMAATPSVAQDALPKQVQIDLIRKEIARAFADKQYAEVTMAMDRYRALGENYPVAYDWLDSRAAQRMQKPVRALASLEAYLRRATSADQFYAEAVGIYPIVKDAGVTALAAVAAAKEASLTPDQRAARDAALKEKDKVNTCNSLFKVIQSRKTAYAATKKYMSLEMIKSSQEEDEKWENQYKENKC